MADEKVIMWNTGDHPLQVGMLLYPGLTLLDLAGPATALGLHGKIHLLWKSLDAVYADNGISINPTATFSDAQDNLDILFVPGGLGTNEAMSDDEILEFLAHAGKTARYITSVCTGSAILAAAGLLDGYRAATHWAFYEPLEALGVKPSHERVCVDGNRLTGGGVTAGIDFSLILLDKLKGRDVAESVQLGMEYDPQPPFNSGNPQQARPEIIDIFSGENGCMYEMNAIGIKIATERRKYLDSLSN